MKRWPSSATRKSRKKRTSTISLPAVPRALFSLGSNLGDREAAILSACRALAGLLGPLALSPPYETEPVSPVAQPNFLNAVAEAPALLPPEVLLAVVKALERRAGRRPGPRGGPRPLDIDLLLWGDQTSASAELTLPHPGLRHRRFVLAPLVDLAPDLCLPPDGVAARDLLARLPDRPRAARRDWLRPLPPGVQLGLACSSTRSQSC